MGVLGRGKGQELAILEAFSRPSSWVSLFKYRIWPPNSLVKETLFSSCVKGNFSTGKHVNSPVDKVI